jgi:suppressor of G2 allele of SKP1
MSHVSQGQAGVAAVAAKRYDEAISMLTKATAAVKSPIWLLALAQAHQQKGDIAKALEYTGAAYESALGRANRRNMIDAQYRRAVLLYRLGRFADADVCAVWSQMLIEGVSPSALASYPGEQDVDEANGGRYKVSLEQVKAKEINPKQTGSDWSAVQSAMGGGTTGDSDKKRPPEWNKAFQWRVQSLGKLEQLAADDPAWLVSIKPAANGEAISAAAKAASPAETKVTQPPASAASKASPTVTAADPPRVEKPAAPVTLETLKPKVDFYQTAKAATLSVYIKDANKEKTEVKYLGSKVRP